MRSSAAVLALASWVLPRPPEGLCPLSDEEFALGIPLTKLVVTFSE